MIGEKEKIPYHGGKALNWLYEKSNEVRLCKVDRASGIMLTRFFERSRARNALNTEISFGRCMISLPRSDSVVRFEQNSDGDVDNSVGNPLRRRKARLRSRRGAPAGPGAGGTKKPENIRPGCETLVRPDPSNLRRR